tara:strand:+ start:478 stop:1242 length:765 start_codon:yes stop_codon:yes gene_type:complete
MDKRYQEIDILKGVAVICMVIFHFFYFPNQYGFKEINYNTNFLNTLAKIAQIIFIGSVGINLTLSYDRSEKKNESKKDYYKKQFFRIFKILGFALFMTIFSYILFKDKFIKFGILHFIAITSLLLFPLINKKLIIQIITIISIIIYYLIKTNPTLFSNVPEKLAFVLGFYNNSYSSIDHFSIFPWIIITLLGINIGYIIKDNKPELPRFIKNNFISNSLEKTGKYSLEIYAIHWIVLYIIFCQLYSKTMRNNFI